MLTAMNKLNQLLESNLAFWQKIYRTLGSMKFAVVIILAFASALVYGTFMESYHGREFANRLVYKSLWFMGMQGLMFASIFIATVDRFPMKKRLCGFYTLHFGLLTLFVGSFFTYVSGIDGMVELLPNGPTNKVSIDESYLYLRKSNGSTRTLKLPFNAFAVDIDETLDNIKVKTFYPSAKLKTHYIAAQEQSDHSGKYLIYNENVSQDFILSINPKSDFKSSQTLGPLNIHYVQDRLYPCFKAPGAAKLIVWNARTLTCRNIEDILGAKLEKTPTGRRFVAIEEENKLHKFFPEISPLPVNEDLTPDQDSALRIFSLQVFERKPNLFIFGKSIAFYHKRKKAWVGKEFASKETPLMLPWMGFKLKLEEHQEGLYPIQRPEFVKPIHDKGSLIEGDLKVVQVEIDGETHWVRNDIPLNLEKGSSKVQMMIRPKEVRLPYQLTLKEFVMKMNPGTQTPASYESFVSLLDGRNQQGAKTHHVFMNNPLKYDDFTFYQSSYFPVGPKTYGSALSVNYDPGRPFKYGGSLLLVLGSIWHFILNRKKKKVFA